VSVEPAGASSRLSDHARHVRGYRQFVNSLFIALLLALALLAFRWVFPYLFSVLVWVWTADAFLILLIAIMWLLGCWAFASGKIRCPGCAAPFANRFHLWVPRACQACGYDITLPPRGTPDPAARH
jgi:hypothetical protein